MNGRAAWRVSVKEWVGALRGRRTLMVVLLSSVLMGPLVLVALKTVMLPLLVLRRMDAVLAPAKHKVPAAAKRLPDGAGKDAVLRGAAEQRFYNASPLTFQLLLNDADNVADSLFAYIRALSPDAYKVMEAYNLDDKIARMDRAGILYQVLADFADLDVRPEIVSKRRWATSSRNCCGSSPR